MKIKKLFCLFTTAIVAFSVFAGNVFAYYDGTTPYDDAPRTKIGSFTYILKQNVQYGLVKVPYSAAVTDIPNIKKVEIPEKVTYNGTEFLVTDVDIEDFYMSTQKKYSGVEEIVLPETVYNITSFVGFPNLKKMNIPKNTIIGRAEDFVYYDNYLDRYEKLIYTNEGLSRFYDDTFYFLNCPNLILSVDPNNPYYSYNNYMLLSKNGKDFYMNFNRSADIIIPDGVENIWDAGAFSDSRVHGYGFSHVHSVRLPNTLKILGWGVFHNSKISEITLPDSLKEIYGDEFSYSSLNSVKFGKDTTLIGVRAFKNCKNLKSLTIPEKVKFISSNAFKNCKGLKDVNIMSKNVGIEYAAFKNCTNLKSVTINGVKKIDGDVFANCKKLSKIVINNKKKAPKIDLFNSFNKAKKGIKIIVKKKKIAKELKKQLIKSKSGVKNAKIMVGKKVIYKVTAKTL